MQLLRQRLLNSALAGLDQVAAKYADIGYEDVAMAGVYRVKLHLYFPKARRDHATELPGSPFFSKGCQNVVPASDRHLQSSLYLRSVNSVHVFSLNASPAPSRLSATTSRSC